mmetsp:Transcript_23100/g.46347  ORF Transcript_23100/g.46347 Transcript_23100/m.46347 type:complete len:81 (-) Transcript_23100:388-630(-)
MTRGRTSSAILTAMAIVVPAKVMIKATTGVAWPPPRETMLPLLQLVQEERRTQAGASRCAKVLIEGAVTYEGYISLCTAA